MVSRLRLRTISMVLVLLVAAGSWTATQACGPQQVCSDVSTSFVGTVDSENVRLDWSTDEEDGSVSHYVLSRYDCGTPSTCTTVVTTIGRSGSCSTTKSYSYTDTPPSPVGSWTYVLQVVKTDNSTACAIFTVPQ